MAVNVKGLWERVDLGSMAVGIILGALVITAGGSAVGLDIVSKGEADVQARLAAAEAELAIRNEERVKLADSQERLREAVTALQSEHQSCQMRLIALEAAQPARPQEAPDVP